MPLSWTRCRSDLLGSYPPCDDASPPGALKFQGIWLEMGQTDGNIGTEERNETSVGQESLRILPRQFDYDVCLIIGPYPGMGLELASSRGLK
jgi:hypothetical protein